MLKPIDQFYEPDTRFENIVQSFDQTTGILTFKSPHGLHDDVAALELNEAVPEKIRHQFDLARNVYLYSWFVYDFATVAEQQAYAALEAALRHRYHVETGKPPDKPSLKSLFDFMIARNLLDAADFEFPAAWAPGGTYSELEVLRMVRNTLAHGKFHLMPGGSHSALETCHFIITRLFSAANTAAAQDGN
jgi:hypothetical protein